MRELHLRYLVADRRVQDGDTNQGYFLSVQPPGGARDQPNLALFQRWFAETDGDLADKTQGIFIHLAQSARHPKWKGCGFLRTSAELANLPGHPAIKIGAAHKKKFEHWMQDCFEAAGIGDGLRLARQIMLLLDGAFAVSLLHRDPSYMETAGDAAHALVKAAAPAIVSTGKRDRPTHRKRPTGDEARSGARRDPPSARPGQWR